MARITVEDCLSQENNRFALVQLASKRTKQLLAGARMLTDEAKGNKAVVTALREIASGVVRFMTPEDEAKLASQLEAQKALAGEEHVTATPTSFADDLFALPSVTSGKSDDDEDDEEEEGPAAAEDA